MTMQFSWWTLAIQAANFLILVWLLERLLYRPVREIVEKRKKLTLDESASAKKVEEDALALKQKYEQALTQINTERERALNQSRAEIAAERKKADEDARHAAAEMMATAKAAADKERADTLTALKDEIADLATQQARIILTDVAPSVPDSVPFAQLERELAAMSAPERQRLQDELSANGDRVGIVTARALQPSEQDTYKQQIEQALGRAVVISFEVDPSLLSGAVLQLPHLVIRSSWADQLDQARQALKRGKGAELS